MSSKKSTKIRAGKRIAGVAGLGQDLSSHDINVISLVAQGPKLPEGTIRNVIESDHFGVSKPAVEIVKIVLQIKSGRKQSRTSGDWKERVASAYVDWAEALQSGGLAGGVVKSKKKSSVGSVRGRK